MANANNSNNGQLPLLNEDQFKSIMLGFLRPMASKSQDQIIIPRTYGPVMIKTNEEKFIEAAFESCAFKCFMSCTLGNFYI